MLGLYLTDKPLDGLPQIGRRFLRARQVPGHLIVTDFPLQQLARASGRGGTKGGQQVIGIQIGYRVLFHTGEFTPFSLPSRKVSSSEKRHLRYRRVGMLPAKADPPYAHYPAHELEPRLTQARAGQRAVFFVDAAHFVLHPFPGLSLVAAMKVCG
jgi:hypothetical protein